MFERLMLRLGYSLTEDLEQHKANADFAFTKLAEVEPELEAAQHQLSLVCSELEWLRREAQVASGDELAVKRARAARLVAGHG